MADQKLTELTEETTPADTDVVYVVVDPDGDALPRKVQLSNLRTPQTPPQIDSSDTDTNRIAAIEAALLALGLVEDTAP